MKKIEIITRPEKLVGLKEVLAGHNCQGMTVMSVMGCGRQKGYLPEMNFTGEDINLLLCPFPFHFPVDPNPPYPRSVLSRLATCCQSAWMTGEMTSCAILSPSWMVYASLERL